MVASALGSNIDPANLDQTEASRGLARLGIDVGGTFTDLVLLRDGQIQTAKVLSTPSPEEGVFAALDKLGALQGELRVDLFCHGMTVATNALLERKGSPTLFLTTVGFRDVLAIARQNRPSLYDLTQPKPEPVVSRHHCLEVKERCSVGGVLEPLTDAEIRRVVQEVGERVQRDGIRAIGVGFLFSFLYPEHEQRLGTALRQAFPDLHLSLSCEVAPEFREYERFSTTAIDAYLSPALAGYLHRLAQGCRERGIPQPLIMQSSGGVTSIPQAAAHASVALLSGPAGGVYGAAYLGRLSGYPHLLSFDMGGTSTDVALIQDGSPRLLLQQWCVACPCNSPKLISTPSVPAADPWPICCPAVGFRWGQRVPDPTPGRPATVGGEQLRRLLMPTSGWGTCRMAVGWATRCSYGGGLAEQAIATLADPLGLSLQETAVGIRTLANVAMSRALRVISVERGLDPADFALLAFGGAGPMHACALAEELGIRTILIPAACGVLSALGMALADLRRDYRRAILQPLRQLTSASGGSLLAQWAEPLIRQAQADLQEPALHFSLDLRYRGQSFELGIPVQLSGSDCSSGTAVSPGPPQRYGWQDSAQPVEQFSCVYRRCRPYHRAFDCTPPFARGSPQGSARGMVWGQDALGAGLRSAAHGCGVSTARAGNCRDAGGNGGDRSRLDGGH
jgi:N-methylhydantoinase A